MEIKNFDQLIERVLAAKKSFRVAIVAAGDTHTLEAAKMAQDKGFITPVLVGDKGAIDRILGDIRMAIPPGDIYDVPDPAKAAAEAVRLVHQGKADFLMKGKLDTSMLLRAVVNSDTGLGTGRLMSTFFLAEIPTYHKLVAVVDGGLVTYPTLEQKRDIIQNTVDGFLDLGYDCPKVGVLACIEKVNPKMPETVDADALKQMNREGEIKNCVVEGPISYDCAMSAESAAMKGYQSPVAGDCDILIAHDIHAGNIMGKMLHVSCHARTAGFITGASCPVVMSSRGSSAEEKFMSIVVAAAVVLGRG